MTEQQTSGQRIYWLISGVLLAAIIAVVGWKLWHVLNPPRTATAALDPACDLHSGPCFSTFEDGTRVSLTINPQPIPILEQLTLDSEIQGVSARKVEVDIVGVNMNMGYIRPELNATGSDGHFAGESILPVCILDEMEWEARLMVHSDNGLMVAPFRFITRK